MEIKIQTLPNISDICPNCFGTGKQKAMQMAMTLDKRAIRDKDIKVKCQFCNGTGLRK